MNFFQTWIEIGLDLVPPSFLVLMLVQGAIMLLFYTVMHVLQAQGLYTMAKGRGMERTYLAWIPGINLSLMGGIADHIQRCKGKRTNYAMILLCLSCGVIAMFLVNGVLLFTTHAFPQIAMAVMVLVVLLGNVLLVAAVVFSFIASHEIFKDYSPHNALLFLGLSILFGINWAFIFALRNKRPLTLGGHPSAAAGGPQSPWEGWQHPYAPPRALCPPQGGDGGNKMGEKQQ